MLRRSSPYDPISGNTAAIFPQSAGGPLQPITQPSAPMGSIGIPASPMSPTPDDPRRAALLDALKNRIGAQRPGM